MLLLLCWCVRNSEVGYPWQDFYPMLFSVFWPTPISSIFTTTTKKIRPALVNRPQGIYEVESMAHPDRLDQRPPFLCNIGGTYWVFGGNIPLKGSAENRRLFGFLCHCEPEKRTLAIGSLCRGERLRYICDVNYVTSIFSTTCIVLTGMVEIFPWRIVRKESQVNRPLQLSLNLLAMKPKKWSWLMSELSVRNFNWLIYLIYLCALVKVVNK